MYYALFLFTIYYVQSNGIVLDYQYNISIAIYSNIIYQYSISIYQYTLIYQYINMSVYQYNISLAYKPSAELLNIANLFF